MIFEVTHQCMGTDDLTHRTTLVRANSQLEAMQKFNAMAAYRQGYPHMWASVDLDAVELAEIHGDPESAEEIRTGVLLGYLDDIAVSVQQAQQGINAMYRLLGKG